MTRRNFLASSAAFAAVYGQGSALFAESGRGSPFKAADYMSLRKALRAFYPDECHQACRDPRQVESVKAIGLELDAWATAHSGFDALDIRRECYLSIRRHFQPFVFPELPFYFEMGVNGGWCMKSEVEVFVPDHSINRKDNSFGVNVLLTPERTVQACLKAYREGNFYGAKRGLNELKFKRIAFSGTTVEAETDKPARLQVITALGPVREVESGTSIKWSMEKPPLAGGPRKDVHMFARVKAYAVDGSGEELFSQPYMLV